MIHLWQRSHATYDDQGQIVHWQFIGIGQYVEWRSCFVLSGIKYRHPVDCYADLDLAPFATPAELRRHGFIQSNHPPEIYAAIERDILHAETYWQQHGTSEGYEFPDRVPGRRGGRVTMRSSG